MRWLDVCLFLYALIMLVGGVMGYRTAGSTASLWTGIISALLIIGATALARSNQRVGYGIAGAVVLVLIGIFLKRYLDTQKVMPSLMLVGGSVVMLVLLAVGHFMGRKTV